MTHGPRPRPVHDREPTDPLPGEHPMKRLPIKSAKDVAQTYGLRQVILCAWDGERTHVVTYGKSETDCDQAAQGGNRVKAAIGFPPEACDAEPSRVRRLRDEIARLRGALAPFANYNAGDRFIRCAFTLWDMENAAAVLRRPGAVAAGRPGADVSMSRAALFDQMRRMRRALEPLRKLDERLAESYDKGWAGGVPSDTFIDGPAFAGALTRGQIREAALAAKGADAGIPAGDIPSKSVLLTVTGWR